MIDLKTYHRNDIVNDFSAQRWNKADDVNIYIDEFQQGFFKIMADTLSDMGIVFAKQILEQHDRIALLEKALRGRCTDEDAAELGL